MPLPADGLSSFALAIAFIIAGAYLVVFLLQLPANVSAFAWNSDIASAFAIPQTVVKTGTGGHTMLGSTGAYIPLWFGLLTASLPLHHELWEVAATAVFATAALTIGWSVSQLSTRSAAILAILLALVASPLALAVFMAAAAHNTVYLGTALLGAYLVWMASARPRRRLTTLTATLLVGVLLGAFLASDFLLLVTGIVPFTATAILAGLTRDRRSRRLAVSALASVAVAVPVAWIISRIMGSFGFATEPSATSAAPLSAFPQHAEYLLEGLKELFGGYLGGQRAPGTLQAVLGIASDVVMAAALLVLPILGAYTVTRLIRSALRRSDAQATTLQLASRLHVIYWTGSAATAALAFMLSVNATGPHPQYYASLLLSVAAVAPLLKRPASVGRWLVPVGASILFAASLVGLTSVNLGAAPFAREESEIARLAQANHATTGYAGYWYASNLTWNSRERVRVRPVSLCSNPTGADFCQFYLNTVPSWFAPATQHTFLLVDPTEEYMSGVPRGLGPPLVAYALPESTTRMYIYPYDIASRLGAASD